MNNNSYFPGQGLFDFISEHIESRPSPEPAPPPENTLSPRESSREASKPIVIAEPADNRCWLVENDKLKDEINYLKTELKIIKNIVGLDRKLKLIKIKKEDVHKYCQYDLYQSSPKYVQKEFSLVLINKTCYDLEPKMIKDESGYKYNPYKSLIPNNNSVCFTIEEKHYLDQRTGPQFCITTQVILKSPFRRGQSEIHRHKNLIDSINAHCSGHGDVNSLYHNIDEYFLMNITFPRLADFMKIKNMNSIDIDIYKMKGIYVITYE